MTKGDPSSTSLLVAFGTSTKHDQIRRHFSSYAGRCDEVCLLGIEAGNSQPSPIYLTSVPGLQGIKTRVRDTPNKSPNFLVMLKHITVPSKLLENHELTNVKEYFRNVNQ